jgi:hypothetical protein
LAAENAGLSGTTETVSLLMKLTRGVLGLEGAPPLSHASSSTMKASPPVIPAPKFLGRERGREGQRERRTEGEGEGERGRKREGEGETKEKRGAGRGRGREEGDGE